MNHDNKKKLSRGFFSILWVVAKSPARLSINQYLSNARIILSFFSLVRFSRGGKRTLVAAVRRSDAVARFLEARPGDEVLLVFPCDPQVVRRSAAATFDSPRTRVEFGELRPG